MTKTTPNPQPPIEGQHAFPGETDMGPLARQRAFLSERLGGSVSTGETARSLTPAAGAATSSTAADLRLQQLTAFRQRQQHQQEADQETRAMLGTLATGVRGMAPPDFTQINRWIPIGPTVVRQGQSGKQPATSGRVRGIAVAPGGQRVYVATANGGVWRSEDAGRTWLSLMDAFDLNPTMFRADSLACGAVALAPGNWAGQDIIYVGSGEPGVSPFFQGDSAYFGVGPIVSSDGGLNWVTEPSQPTLAGRAFYALAVDPLQPQRVVAATYEGLYRRDPDGAGGFVWVQKRPNVFCSVVVTHRAGVTTFYAAQWGGGVFQSTDGEQWSTLGKDFPTANVQRIGLAVQADNPDVLYALVCNGGGHLHGAYRLDTRDGKWRPVRDVPVTLFGPDLNRGGQGTYDLAITVDPTDVNRIYIGGSIVHSDGVRPHPFSGDWSGSLYRCEIEIHPTTKTVRAKPTYIGGSIHGDLHTLVFAPSDPNKLWVGCDGGVFYSTKPGVDPAAPEQRDGIFIARNTGLATLTMNHLGHHPTEEAVLFCGTQDNGGLRYTGEPAWLYSSGGDSGSFVINWRDPYLVMGSYVNTILNRSSTGGMRYNYQPVNVVPAGGENSEFYAPIAGTPYQPENPASADLVAFGGQRVWISPTFGGQGLSWNGNAWVGEVDWRSIPQGDAAGDLLNAAVNSLIFATADKLYAGTMSGGVYRFTKTGDQWAKTELHPVQNRDASATPAPVTAIAIDPADPNGDSIYITLGGLDNPHRVWHYDGANWEPRSGPQDVVSDHPLALLNVQHNAIVADPLNPTHLYIAADIGVWRSVDAGQTWEVFSTGLPDAAVVDLKLHAPGRLLRAATHGRGVYEFDLGRAQSNVELFVRDNQLDLGRRPAAIGLFDPVHFGQQVGEADSPDIQLDALDAEGQYQFPTGSNIDFYEFVDQLQDDGDVVWTHATASLKTRVYVQIHNHGKITANNVRVLLLLTKADETLPALPAGYDNNVRNGMPVENDVWQTVGVTMVHGIRPGYPQVAMFELNSDLLPLPSQLTDGSDKFSLVALLHNTDDPFITDEPTVVKPRINRKAARKMIVVNEFTGRLPQPITPRKGVTGNEPPAFLVEHRVRRGDTLSAIAKHYYNNAHRWPMIYRANQALIGVNPDVLRVGLILKIPKLEV